MRNGRFHLLKYRGKVQIMRVLYIHSSKIPGPSPNFLITSKKVVKNKLKKKPKKLENRIQACSLLDCKLQLAGNQCHRVALVVWLLVNNPWSLTGCGVGPLFCIAASPFFLILASIFFHMWSTLPHWLQHMPALPRFILKFSNIHNFLSLVPKIMKFYSHTAYSETH